MSNESGKTAGIDAFYSSLYGDLRRLAHQRLLRSEPITLLNTTALVHESYLKFLAAGHPDISDRAAFLGYAARVMRSVIVDFVRRRRAEKRGARRGPLDFAMHAWDTPTPPEPPEAPVPPEPPMPPAAPANPTSEERLMILRMLEEKKITAEQAAQLLTALGG